MTNKNLKPDSFLTKIIEFAKKIIESECLSPGNAYCIHNEYKDIFQNIAFSSIITLNQHLILQRSNTTSTKIKLGVSLHRHQTRFLHLILTHLQLRQINQHVLRFPVNVRVLQLSRLQNVTRIPRPHKPKVKYLKSLLEPPLLLLSRVIVQQVAKISQANSLLLPHSIIGLGPSRISNSQFSMNTMNSCGVGSRNVPFDYIFQGVVVHILQVVLRFVSLLYLSYFHPLLLSFQLPQQTFTVLLLLFGSNIIINGHRFRGYGRVTDILGFQRRSMAEQDGINENLNIFSDLRAGHNNILLEQTHLQSQHSSQIRPQTQSLVRINIQSFFTPLLLTGYYLALQTPFSLVQSLQLGELFLSKLLLLVHPQKIVHKRTLSPPQPSLRSQCRLPLNYSSHLHLRWQLFDLRILTRDILLIDVALQFEQHQLVLDVLGGLIGNELFRCPLLGVPIFRFLNHLV